ncbi:MAG: hypothetical protein U9O55_02875 [Patescibacteria group bacterium]|nr:hypothetical protein [Patescibacteria group bacterium]
MNNQEKFLSPDIKPKYFLKKENIIEFSKLPDNLSERKKSLGWPVEIQGSGRIIEGTNDFEIRYPRGDIFLSLGITIHELGHLRQEEFNNEIKKIDKENEREKYIEAIENDAYQRGIERVKKYFPEILEEIEKKFQEYKKQGELENFSSFEELYKFLQGSININRALNTVSDIDDKNKQDELEYKALKKIGIEKFFSDIKKSRVKEKIDKKWIEDFIMKMAEKISNE